MLKTSKLIIVLFFLFLITGTCNAQKKKHLHRFQFCHHKSQYTCSGTITVRLAEKRTFESQKCKTYNTLL